MCTENQYSDKEGNSKNSSLSKYAWKWFEYHAKQRVSMFNFFLLASGVFAHATVSLICEKYFIPAMGLAFIGIIVSFSFLVLDRRNAGLVDMGEDVLRRLEDDSLFPKDFRGLDEEEKATCRGILKRESDEKKRKTGIQWYIQHKYVLRFIEIVISICFLILLIFAVYLYFKICIASMISTCFLILFIVAVYKVLVV